MNFSAVILAGGQSNRMGRDKAWLELDGQTLLSRQLQLARNAGAAELFISGRAGVDYSGLDGRVILDAFPDAGPLAGIERALEAAAHSLCLTLAVDMPDLSPAFLRELLARCEADRGVVPRLGHRLEPLAAVYPRSSQALARQLLQADRDASPRQLARTCADSGTVTIYPVNPADAWRLRSWNQPSDATGLGCS
jgi:molybdopterin-guanine dinucleotide biosynthesis protein A